MTIKNIGFVGFKTPKFQETASLFRDCLDVPVTSIASSKIGFKLNDGAIVEMYGPKDEFHSFFKTGPVVGFTVSNFDTTKQNLIAHGVDFIGNSQHINNTRWQHFYLPDGTIAEIIG